VEDIQEKSGVKIADSERCRGFRLELPFSLVTGRVIFGVQLHKHCVHLNNPLLLFTGTEIFTCICNVSTFWCIDQVHDHVTYNSSEERWREARTKTKTKD
jgi:hypothetical protein